MKYFRSVYIKLLKGLDGVYAIADDILIAGTKNIMKDVIAEHDLKTGKLLRRCQGRNINLNKQKAIGGFLHWTSPDLTGGRGRPVQG